MPDQRLAAPAPELLGELTASTQTFTRCNDNRCKRGEGGLFSHGAPALRGWTQTMQSTMRLPKF